MLKRKWIKLFLAFAVAVSGLPMAGTVPKVEAAAAPPYVLITEIMFNSKQPSGVSAEPYEYIEIYNNSNKTINLKDYKIIYDYYDNRAPLEWDITEDKPLAPGAVMVLWNVTDPANNGGITDDLSNFNTAYGTSLTESQVTRFHSGGMANTGGRSLSLALDHGLNRIVTASYNAPNSTDTSDSADGKTVTYQPPAAGTHTMIKLGSKVAPTPGTLAAGQTPAAPVHLPADYWAPYIEHTPTASGIEAQNFTVSASVYEETQLVYIKLLYQTDKQSSFTSLPMTVAGMTYSATIPKTELIDASSLHYYFEASDGTNVTRLPEQTDQTFSLSVYPEVNYNAVPDLLITEIVPNPDSPQTYEYVEVYNTTDRPINLKDYKLKYIYPNNTFKDWDLDENKLVQPQSAMVLWINNTASQGKTTADFNANFGSSITDDQMVRTAPNDGMINSEKRTLALMTDTGAEISRASYNDGEQANEAVSKKGIVYEYPKDGSKVMMKRAYGQTATPAAVIAGQVPPQAKSAVNDTTVPVIDHTMPLLATPPIDLTLKAGITDDNLVKRVTFYRKNKEEDTFKAENLEKNSEGFYEAKTISLYDLQKTEALEYYFEASDGNNVVTSMAQNGGKPYAITIQHEAVEPLTLNVKTGDFLSGTQMLLGASSDENEATSLFVDGVKVPTVNKMVRPATFVMEVDGFNAGYKNGLLVGNKVLKIFDANITGNQIVTVEIPADDLKSGANVISVSSGNRVDPLDTTDNNDDFTIQNVRLVLPDGTIIPVESTQIKMGDGSYAAGPTGKIALGDGSFNDVTAKERADMTFTIPDDKLTGRTYAWDTTQVAEGPHTVSIQVDGSEPLKKVSAEVIVDNTKPFITALSIEENKTYKGSISFSISADDALSGIAAVEGKLDGNDLSLPAVVNALNLTPGTHEFEAIVTDKAGNELVKKIPFSVVEEHPYKPVNPSPAQGAAGVDLNASLAVTVNDPTGDPLDVTFYKAYQYDFTDKTPKQAFSNGADREPPLELEPAGETPFSGEAVEAVKAIDGQYFSTEYDEKLPYQRFEFTIADDLTGIEQVEVQWRGHSKPERQVTLYTWNHTTGKWQAAASGMGTEDFTLKANVSVADMVKDQKIHVLVQDLIPSPDQYDFSFAWMSDTQYYSESWPDTYKTMTKWIADHAQEKKIQYVVHTGDIVDDFDQPDQWAAADASMKTLDDAQIPYGVVAGNHDVNHNEAVYNEYWKYFGRHRFENNPWYGGDLENNRDHYDLISAKGNDFIILYLGWQIDDQTIQWADEVLKKYPDRNAIIATHEYIAPGGFYAGQGEDLWKKLVSKNQNVFMVLCGHIHGVAYNVRHGDNGNTVIEMLADYQSGPQGGLGYMRLLQFDMKNNQLMVNTYSPLLDDYIYFEDKPEMEEFSLPIHLKPIAKQVATDYIGVNVYTKEKIGERKNVPSGSRAEVPWRLNKGSSMYYWYTTLEDAYGGFTTSDIYEFTTGTGPVSNGSDSSSGSSGGGAGGGAGGALPGRNSGTDGSLQAVKPDDLKGQSGPVSISVADGRTGVSLPANAAEYIGENSSISIRTSEVHLSIPSDVLVQAANLLPAGERGGSQIMVKIEPAAEKRGEHLLSRGRTYDLTIEVMDSTGTVSRLTEFAKPVTITLPAGHVTNPRLAGIYYIDDNGKFHFIGGTYAQGSYTANVNHFSVYGVFEYVKTYQDVPSSHWAYSLIQELSFKGIADGISDSLFAPENPVTRAEFAALLVRALGLKASPGAAHFKDLNGDAWYTEAVNAAYESGIVQGTNELSFEPDRTISREEMAVMIVRAMEKKSGKPLAEGKADFIDAGQISAWAQSAVGKAAALHIIEGRSGGQFVPSGSATRAESAKLILTLVNKE
ncbi:S-layer homology domain-containing protein [Paenibacillus naphthalenovorans]|uniref:S-layer homology domain-containing protein n=1 Tax=Paenibacillus naphthalenovorans TaxID=162209 RepID=UPI000941E055|nr:S-layer homology domain-containing protein [Paenibacillus naphthalenovorans]